MEDDLRTVLLVVVVMSVCMGLHHVWQDYQARARQRRIKASLLTMSKVFHDAFQVGATMTAVQDVKTTVTRLCNTIEASFAAQNARNQ